MTNSSPEAKELRRLHTDVFWTEKGHFTAAGWWRGVHTGLGLVATAGSAAAGGTIVAEGAPVLGGLAALAAAVTSALLTFLKPREIADAHLRTGRKLTALRVELRQALELDLPSATATQDLRQKITELSAKKAAWDQDSPHLPNLTMRLVDRRIRKKAYDSDGRSLGI